MNVKLLNTLRKVCGYRMPRMGSFIAHPLMRRLPPSFEVELLPGVRCTINPKDEVQLQAYWLGSRFEAETQRDLLGWAETGTAFFDIGANFGFYSALIGSRFPKLPIYPFEPNPGTFQRLKNLAERNSLKNVHPQALALSDQSGELEFFEGIFDTGSSSFGVNKDRPGKSIGMVPTIAFDEWLAQVGLETPASPEWFAKIDVEGFEPKVLRGMASALKSKSFFALTIEVSPYNLGNCGSTAGDLYEPLLSAGYQPSVPLARIEADKLINVIFALPAR
jgi:FkbM family methyltransferase